MRGFLLKELKYGLYVSQWNKHVLSNRILYRKDTCSAEYICWRCSSADLHYVKLAVEQTVHRFWCTWRQTLKKNSKNFLETYFEIESESVAIFWPFYFGHSFGHKELRAKVTWFPTLHVCHKRQMLSKIDHYVTLNAFNINSTALLVLRWHFCFIIPRGISLSLSFPHIFAINLRGNRQTCYEINSH